MKKNTKKHKRVVWLILSFLVIIALIYIIIFTPILGHPHYVKIGEVIHNTNVTDIKVSISYNNIDKLKYFSKLKKLEISVLAAPNRGSNSLYNLENLNFLRDLKIEELVLINQKIEDWSAINELLELNKIFIHNSNFDNFKILGNLGSLESITAWSCELKTIDGIENLKSLVNFDIYNNNINDISLVSELKELKEIDLTRNPINDYSAIFKMPNLKKLFIEENVLTNEQIDLLNLKGVELVFPK